MIINTINIELVVRASHYSQQDIWMQGVIELKIDSEKTEEIYNDDNDIIDYHLLRKSLKQDGTYFIFTCSCGIPECGGRLEGIQVTTKGQIIEWVDLDFDKTWQFDKNDMIEQMNTIRKEARDYKAFFKKKDIKYVGVEYVSDDSY